MPKTAAPAPQLLTREQEQLVKKWIPLARGIVNKQVGGDKAEQLSRALWALAKAARSFDPSRKITFQALATCAIKRALIDCHRAAARHAGAVELKDHHIGNAGPAPKWTPPPDPKERRIRAPGLSSRSIRRRAAEQGWSRPRGRGRILDGEALLRILTPNPKIPTTQLARALGVSRFLFYRCAENGQLLARMRELATVRIFGHGATPDRTATGSQSPSSAPAPIWR